VEKGKDQPEAMTEDGIEEAFDVSSDDFRLFCLLAVLDPTVGYTMDVLSLFISVHSVIAIDSSTGSPVHILMLCSQAVRGFPIACVHLASFLPLSLSPGNSLVSSWWDHSMLASLL